MSSNEQDKFILNYFTNLHGPSYKGKALDVGANDGVFYSNTLLLEQQGWDVMCVEANSLYRDSLSKNRKQHIIAAASNINKPNVTFNVVESSMGPEGLKYASHSALNIVGQVSASLTLPVHQLTLDTILDMWGILPPLDLLSIDIEGGELLALQGFSINKWRPKLVCVEVVFNPHAVELLVLNGYKILTTLDPDVICELL